MIFDFKWFNYDRYIIAKEDNKKLENLAKKVSNIIDCNNYLRHKTLMIPPSVLKKNKIKFARVCFFVSHLFRSISLSLTKFIVFISIIIKLGSPKSWTVYNYTTWHVSFWIPYRNKCSGSCKFWIWRVAKSLPDIQNMFMQVSNLSISSQLL